MRLRRAAVLGLLHGPAELLPVSSSAHAALLLQDVGPERRKELEVALHAGTLAALGLPRPSRWLALATAPAAVAGALLERPIERRLGTPRTVAAGLLLGGLAMAAADAKKQPDPTFAGWDLGAGRGARRAEPEPSMGDALVLGLAQAAALVPGVSRHGAALTALRARGFTRPDAHRISREASKPVLLGATVLKGARALRGGDLAPLAVAAAGSAVSTWGAKRALEGRGERMPLWPLAIYRAALGASVSRVTTRDIGRRSELARTAGRNQDLTGRVVAITGAARGIGRATAAELQRRGAKVAIGDLAGYAETGAELEVAAYALDVTDRASFTAFLDAVEADLGPLDVLINNAGIAPIGQFADEPDAVTRKILDVDLFGVALGSKLAVERMRPRGRGHVINLGSGASRVPVAGLATYTAAKHAVIGLTESLRQELRGSGIELTVVLPGMTETDMIAHTRRTKRIRVVQPEDIAGGIADAVARPRAEVWVPRANEVMHRLTAGLTTDLRQRMLRTMQLDRVYADADHDKRADIEARMRAGA